MLRRKSLDPTRRDSRKYTVDVQSTRRHEDPDRLTTHSTSPADPVVGRPMDPNKSLNVTRSGELRI